MRLPRPAIGSVTLSLLVTAWLVLVLNKVFWINTAAAFGDRSTALTAFAIGICALFIAALVSVSVKYLTKPLFIFLIVSAAPAAWFMEQYGVIIDTDMIRNAAETTSAEAGNLMTAGFIRHMIIYALLPSLFIALVRIKHRTFGAKVKYNLAVILPALLLTFGLGAWQYQAVASAIRNNRIMMKTLNPMTPVASAVKFVIRSSKSRTIVVKPLDPDATLGPRIAKADKPVLTIIIPGETARAQDFSLDGYERKTNPELEKRDIVFFDNTYSCGTATATSLPCMFSNLKRSGYSYETGLANENLLDVLQYAGVSVTWWENNTGDKNVARRIKKRDFSVENDPRFCINTECRDEVMVDSLGAWLDGLKGNATLVMHQLGSHGPAYYARYTEAERVFRPDCRTAELADCTTEEIRNAYDNTIIATDRMLAQVIDLLAARSDRIASAMVYISDHGESLGEKGLFLHGLPYMLAPEEQTRVPFLMWMSPSYSKIFGVDSTCLSARKGEAFSHDNLFDTVLGLMDIKASHYDPANDVTAPCRTPSS